MIVKPVCLNSFKLSTTVAICFLIAQPSSTDAAPTVVTVKQMTQAAEVRSGLSSRATYAGPMIESTGFETTDGWVARDGVNNGFICGPEFADCSDPDPLACPDPGGNCCIDDPNPDTGWHVSISSMHCTEPHIDTVNPAAGQQHLRFQRVEGNADGHWGDTPGCVSFDNACRQSAFSPLAAGDGPLDEGVTNMDMDIYASGTFGSSFVVYEVAESSFTLIAGYIYFAYWGYIYVYEPGVAFHSTNMEWTPGVYQHLTVRHDPYNNVMTYMYGNDVFSHPMDNMAKWVSRVILQNDNAGEFWDVDNFSIDRESPYPTTCSLDGDEECYDYVEDGDLWCPGRCVKPGRTGPNGEPECTCIRRGITPCNATELADGVFEEYTHGGWFTFVAVSSATAIETCGSSGFDSLIEIYTTSFVEDCGLGTLVLDTLVATNDNCDDLSELNSADPLASCYNSVGPPNWEACTCFPTNVGQRYWVREVNGGGKYAAKIRVTKSKRFTCDAIWDNGACCRGLTGKCENDIPQANCLSDFDNYTHKMLCETSPVCEVILGACCDASPGLAGECTNDVVYADCIGTHQSWSANTTCNDLSCEEVTGACCDRLDGFCSVTLRDDCSVSHPNGPVWTASKTCNEVMCDPALGACCNTRFGTCTNDVTLSDCTGDHLNWTKQDICSAGTCPDPFIPTVSQWGLAVMTLLLLIGAKIYFGRQSKPEI